MDLSVQTKSGGVVIGSKKKWIANLIFLVLILGLTCYGMLHDENPAELLRLLDQANGWYWLPGIALVVAFICCESLILRLLLTFVGQPVARGHCLIYSFIGFFFSGITPSAGGGQPAQIYFMHKDGLSPGLTAPVLVIVTICYKLVLVIYGLIALIVQPPVLTSAPELARLWYLLGFAATILAVGLFCMLIFWQSAVERLLRLLFRGAGHLFRPGRLERWHHRLEHSLEKYREVTDCMQKGPWMFLVVIGISFLQRTLLFLVPWLVLRSFGVVGVSLPSIVILQALVSLGTDLLPLPGGTGANEALFLMLFEGLCGETLVLPVLLASRGISYYGQVLVSGVVSLIAGTALRKKETS